MRIEPQPEGYESTPTTRLLAPTQARRCEQLAQSCYLVVHRLGIKPWNFRSRIQRLNRWATKRCFGWTWVKLWMCLLTDHFDLSWMSNQCIFSRPYLSNGQSYGMVVVCPSVCLSSSVRHESTVAKRCEIGIRLLLITNRKSHMSNDMKIDDLG